MKIQVTNIQPSIPAREFDYCAIDEDTFDGSQDSPTRNQIGYGKTAEEAIEDLKQILDESKK